MNIEAFLLCDYATEDRGGKLNVLGAFHTLYASEMPCVHPACAVVGRIRFTRIEEGKHKIRINIIDQDGQSIGPKKLEGEIMVRLAEDADSAVVNFVLHFQRLKLQNYGQYRVDLAIDGRQEATLPLNVKEKPGKSEQPDANL